MADITRTHPTATTQNTIMAPAGGMNFIEVDYLAAVNGKTGPASTIAAVTQLLGVYGTVVYAGPLFDSNTRQLFGLEGMTQDTGVAEFGTLTVIQAALQALGTVDSIGLGSATAFFGGPSASHQDVVGDSDVFPV